MGGNEYVDIFATKGLEYRFVIGFLLTLVLFWRFLNSPTPRLQRHSSARAPSQQEVGWFSLEKNLYYHQGHSWAKPLSNGIVRVGIDDFAQKLLGRATQWQVPDPGTRVEQGEKGWKVQVDSTLIDILSPVGGEVVAVNQDLLRSPELVNEDPYGAGWILEVKTPRTNANLKNLLSGDMARAWIEQAISSLRTRMSGSAGLVLQDGGAPVSGFARSLSPDGWEEIANEFLLNT
jgi:glycine cleavage system H lipoate-binding protein